MTLPVTVSRPMGLEDRQLLAAAAAINRDLITPKPYIYWSDLLATSLIAYAALVGAVLLPFSPTGVLLAIVAVLAFYRGLSFIHELSHISTGRLPGFAAAWNMLFGVPLFAPSFMYDGVHTLHHAKSTYGTSRDPEYLPLASMRPRATFLFVLASVLAPIGLLVRFAVLSPASVVSGRLRLWTIARYSALAINPAFRRSPPDGALRARWIQQEVAASAWSMLLVTAAVSGVASIHGVVVGLLVGSGVAVLNQIRTLAAHRWENEAGSAMSVTEQYLDSVNVPSPALLPALWAPVGLRYHALHHLLPSLPYHALASAHRRMARECCSTTYSTANARGFGAVLARLRARQRSHNTGYGRPIAPPRPDVQPGILALPQTFRPRIGDDPHRHHNDAGRSAFGICPRRDAS